MELLMGAGFEAFDLDVSEDKKVWKARQEELGLKPDGVPGPHTCEVLKENGYEHGLWSLGKVPPPKIKERHPFQELMALFKKLFSRNASS